MNPESPGRTDQDLDSLRMNTLAFVDQPEIKLGSKNNLGFSYIRMSFGGDPNQAQHKISVCLFGFFLTTVPIPTNVTKLNPCEERERRGEGHPSGPEHCWPAVCVPGRLSPPLGPNVNYAKIEGE